MSGMIPAQLKQKYATLSDSLRSDPDHRLALRRFQEACIQTRSGAHLLRSIDLEKQALTERLQKNSLKIIATIANPVALLPGRVTNISTYITCLIALGIPYGVNSAVGALKSYGITSYGITIAILAAVCDSTVNVVLTSEQTKKEIAALGFKSKQTFQDIKNNNITKRDFIHWTSNILLVWGVLQGAIPAAATLPSGFLAACAELKKTASPFSVKILSALTNPFLIFLIQFVETAFLAKAAVAQLRKYFLDRVGLTGGDGGASDSWKALWEIIATDSQDPRKNKALALLERATQKGLIGGILTKFSDELDDSQKIELLKLAFKDARSSERQVAQYILTALQPKYSTREWLWKNKWEILNWSLSLLLMISFNFATAPSINELYKTKSKDWFDQLMVFLWVWPNALLNPWVAAIANAIQIPLYIGITKSAIEQLWGCVAETVMNTQNLTVSSRLKNIVKDVSLLGFFTMTIFNLLEIAKSGVKGENFGSPLFMSLMARLLPPAAYFTNGVTYTVLRKCLDKIPCCGVTRRSKPPTQSIAVHPAPLPRHQGQVNLKTPLMVGLPSSTSSGSYTFVNVPKKPTDYRTSSGISL